ncbi:Lrp/AsnC family transcriptional regulator [Rickettsiales endosymbiont of Paramecium tredecaurelia]|uniref:Lrp/AsnC family transcriptional regulator n=1 Tax=Candidatus Sarmatiella mevalonica TaxID=2770581 RepID=UPI0019214B1A|nr:Lrp/AsnC family transcriptional regulator [Candidatus Sarmatiella mevalonica]MBL3285174.1 Lrp/AsnC family transcriptional regulator [Candidatus Sarmatiella mevalonica]
MSMQNNEYDHLDRMIARCIMQDATLTSTQLGEKIRLSSSAANERLRRLKQHGHIKKITALVSAKFMDMALCAFIFVTLDKAEHHHCFLHAIAGNTSVLECHHVTGECSYILKVRCANTKALECLITDFLKRECNVAKTLTQIVLSSHKDESLIVD